MTAERYEAQVAAALGAVGVDPPKAYLWFGRRVTTDEPLVDAIGQRLRDDFYGDGAPRPRHGGPVTPVDDGGEFVRALSQANCGRGSWQAGWRVAAAGGDATTVVRPDGLALLAPAEDLRANGATEVRIPKELIGFSPGFYVALGDAPAPTCPRVGVHWNVAGAGAVALVSRVTYALNGAGLPFSLELPDNPARYGRRDGAVLLLARTDFAAAFKLLRPLLRALGPQLADAAPALTKPLTRGVAIAEEPESAESFGEHRCRLLAGAIVAASERGSRTIDDRLAVVREHFRAAGLSLDAPYLQPGSDDAYDLS